MHIALRIQYKQYVEINFRRLSTLPHRYAGLKITGVYNSIN